MLDVIRDRKYNYYKQTKYRMKEIRIDMLQKNILNEKEVAYYLTNDYQKKAQKAFESLFNCLTEENRKKLPTVRIAKISLRNFKNVEKGEITFNCGKRTVTYGTESDILGLYGQNGSGKTTLINALELVRMMMLGVPYSILSQICYGYVKADADYATIRIVFDLQYPIFDLQYPNKPRTRKAVYEFSFKDEVRTIESSEGKEKECKMQILNEKISMGGYFYGDEQRLQTVIDTSNTKTPFASVAKQKEFIGGADKLAKVEKYRQKSFNTVGSFVFMKEPLKYYKKQGNYSEFYQVLLELKCFAFRFFFMIGSHISGLIRMNIGIVLCTINGDIVLRYNSHNYFKKEDVDFLEEHINKISLVMEQLIPGMKLKLKRNLGSVTKEGHIDVDLVVIRNGLEIPVKYESEGICRLISVMSLFIWAFSQQSVTVAIDEFDAGIFEYLLGEILEIFQESGKGQLIFTAHNLRPLEVLDKKFIFFTTTDPKKRYTQLKNIGKTNNLRRSYLREIVIGSDEDPDIYFATEKCNILQALYEAKPEILKEARSNG